MRNFVSLAQENKHQFRRIKKQFEAETAQRSPTLEEVNIEISPKGPVRCWVSRWFYVQLYLEKSGARLSVNRCAITNDGHWKDDITWDELMKIKGQAGFGDWWAIEIFPPANEVVNVANMRHLWLLKEAPTQAWRK
jgi:hypothetical protein